MRIRSLNWPVLSLALLTQSAVAQYAVSDDIGLSLMGGMVTSQLSYRTTREGVVAPQAGAESGSTWGIAMQVKMKRLALGVGLYEAVLGGTLVREQEQQLGGDTRLSYRGEERYQIRYFELPVSAGYYAVDRPRLRWQLGGGLWLGLAENGIYELGERVVTTSPIDQVVSTNGIRIELKTDGTTRASSLASTTVGVHAQTSVEYRIGRRWWAVARARYSWGMTDAQQDLGSQPWAEDLYTRAVMVGIGLSYSLRDPEN